MVWYKLICFRHLPADIVTQALAIDKIDNLAKNNCKVKTFQICSFNRFNKCVGFLFHTYWVASNQVSRQVLHKFRNMDYYQKGFFSEFLVNILSQCASILESAKMNKLDPFNVTYVLLQNEKHSNLLLFDGRQTADARCPWKKDCFFKN